MTVKYFSCAETAGFVRSSLKESFPGVRFSVRGSKYSGGASIYVSWTDGPNEAQVQAVVAKFKASYFDSGIDYQGSIYHMVDGQQARFGADYINFSREYSDEAVQQAIDRFARHYAGNLREDQLSTPTVAQWRKGELLSVRLSSVHFSYNQSVHREIGEILAKNSDRLRVAHSKTAGRVFVTHDDGYGRAHGTGSGAVELVGV